MADQAGLIFFLISLVLLSVSVISVILLHPSGNIFSGFGLFFLLRSILAVVDISFLVYLVFMWIMIGVRRLHDIGLNGWYLIIPLIHNVLLALLWSDTISSDIISSVIFPPFSTFIYAFFILFYLFLFLYPGSKVQNKYGDPQPKRSFGESII